jgi:hypothetical protein
MSSAQKILAEERKKELEGEQTEEQVEGERQFSGILTPFCEANLNFVHNELLYILHPRMQIGETVYIENAP